MATAKAERLLNLVIALVNAPRYRTAAWIRERVAGYADAPTEEAFFRMFERDKVELRDLGIPIQTSGSDQDDLGSDDAGTAGYRIPRVEFALPPVSFTQEESTALGLAARLWDTTALASAGTGALRKIREAGTDTETAPAASGLLAPRVRTADAAFEPLYTAVQARRAVTFDYRKSPDGPAVSRAVHPWGLVSHRGRWYLVGHDRHRDARRTFRLSRIVGEVKVTGRAGAVTVPDGLDLLGLVADHAAESGPPRSATLRIRAGRCAGLRRSADVITTGTDWDEIVLPIRHLGDTAREIVAVGPDAVVLEPADLRAAVIGLLQGALDATGSTS